MGSTYTITVREDDLRFVIVKDGVYQGYMKECKNVEWALQNALASIKRTESEFARQTGVRKR